MDDGMDLGKYPSFLYFSAPIESLRSTWIGIRRRAVGDSVRCGWVMVVVGGDLDRGGLVIEEGS